MIERKFIDLKALKVSDEGNGTIEGYRSVFGEIDEGGDIIIKGAFKNTLAEYLHAGFTAHSHDWDFDKAVGFPVEAYEDEHGWFVKSQFHSTPDAQNVRTKARERMDAGKKVGFSFGYAVKESSVVEIKNYDKELPQYISPARLKENLSKANQFPRIRILKEVEAIEDSLVTAGMNKLAMATGVKMSIVEAGLPFGTVEINGKTIPTGGYGCHTCSAQFKKLDEAAEHGQICRALNNEKNQKSDESVHLPEAESDVSEKSTPNPEGITESESFGSFESAVSELEKFAQKMQSNHDNRVKDGRVLSASNRAKVQACYDALGALLSASEPKPKEKEIDVEALRTQSLRARNKALGALAL